MVHFRRPSDDRLIEETARQQLSLAEQERARSRLLGDVDRRHRPSRNVVAATFLLLVLVCAAVIYLAAQQPADEDAGMPDVAAGSATHESTRVRPPTWWPPEP